MSRGDNDPVLLAQRPTAVVPPVGPQDLFLLFQHLMRVPAFFREVRAVFQPHLLDPVSEAVFRILWHVLCQAHDQYSAQDYGSRLVTYLTAVYLQNSVERLSYEAVEELTRMGPGGVIYDAFHLPEEDFSLGAARDVLRRFLYERSIAAPLRRVATQGWHAGCPANLGEVLQSLAEQHRRNTNVDRLPIVPSVIPLSGENRPALVYHPTGIRFIDEVVQGNCEGDVYGILGASGSGKTTLSFQIAASTARQSWLEAQQNGGPVPLTVCFSAEQPVRQIRPMVQSSLMRIPIQKLVSFTDASCLTTRDRLDPYEMEIQSGNPEPVGELERWQAGAVIMEQALVLVDFSRGEDFPDAGTGGIEEVVSILERIVETRRQPLRCVVIDWVGCLVDRHVMSRGKDESAYRHILSHFVDVAKSKIAQQFRCTVWAAHQLAGRARGFSPLKLIGVEDAAECKSFANHAAACAVICNEDKSTGCRYLHWSKLRHQPAEPVPRILRRHELFAEFVDVTAQYERDTASRRFVTRDIAAHFDAESPPRAQRGPRGVRSSAISAAMSDD